MARVALLGNAIPHTKRRLTRFERALVESRVPIPRYFLEKVHLPRLGLLSDASATTLSVGPIYSITW